MHFTSRSNYIVYFLIILLIYLNFKKIFDIKNLLLILFSTIIILPSTYFLYKWGGIVPPSPGSQVRVQNINLNNVPLIFNIILIYLLPFVFFNFRSNYAKINKKKIFLIFAAFFIFLFLFYKFEPNQFAGGALNKLFYLFLPNEFIKFTTIIFALISFILFIFIFDRNWKLLLFVFLNIIFFLKLDFVFQEYFDPIFLILVFSFSDKLLTSVKNINGFVYFILTYFVLFLISDNFYQYQIA